jgi:thiamine-phosphate pyrophosphorylase
VFTLCLVTDRRRLGQAFRAVPGEWASLVVRQAFAAARGGVDLICVRERDLEGADLMALVRDVVAAARGYRARVVVNDRLDVALAAPADGVHLREASFGPADVRELSVSLLCGCSIHDPAGAVRRRGAAYFLAGAVLPTPSKTPPARHLGWEGLAAVTRAAGPVPVLGIGGLAEEHVPDLFRCGAAGLAAVGAFIPTEPKDLDTFVQQRATTLRKRIDLARGVF